MNGNGNSTTGPILLVDGNSLIHRGFHAMEGSGLTSPDGRPSWALKGFWNFLVSAVDRVGAGGVTIGFDSHESYRAEVYDDYKAGRAQKTDELRSQLHDAPIHLERAGLQVAVVHGYEADDVVASAAARNQRAGIPSVIVTSDKDAFSLITDDGPGVRMLRVVNGGHSNWPLLTSDRLRILCGVYPHEYRLFAALRGDASDNLPGVNGCGPKTATKLIESLRMTGHTLDDVLTDHDSGGTRLSDTIGNGAARKFDDPTSRENLERNLELMKQFDTLDVGPIDAAALPVPRGPLVAELGRWRLRVNTDIFSRDDVSPLAGLAPSLVQVREREMAPALF